MHSWINGPEHFLYLLELLRTQQKKVVEMVMPTVKGSAWYAHSEAILQSMLASKDRDLRKKGVEKILEIRGEGNDDRLVTDLSGQEEHQRSIQMPGLCMISLTGAQHQSPP